MTTADFNRYFPFFAVALVVGVVACIAPGQTALAVAAIGSLLAIGLITDLVLLGPLPPQHRTSYPLLLAWSLLLIGALHFVPAFRAFSQ